LNFRQYIKANMKPQLAKIENLKTKLIKNLEEFEY
jgi:hypothetical protein